VVSASLGKDRHVLNGEQRHANNVLVHLDRNTVQRNAHEQREIG